MKVLKELRDRAGLTLRQVEEATLISNSYLSQLENGKIIHPSAQSLYVLAKLYSVSVEMLLVEAGLVKEVRVEAVKMADSLEKRVEKLESQVSKLIFNDTIFNHV